MRIAAVTMLRNEADILPDFLGHCAALFDEVLAVDHASTDGTTEMLAAAAARRPLTVWRFAQDAKMQSMMVTALAREAAARGADWIVPLDADEFPIVASRAALEAALADGPPVRNWTWRNIWPGTRDGFARFTLAGTHDSVASPIRKVLFRREVALSGAGFRVETGSHVVIPAPAPPAPVGEVLHVPLRHIDRFALKIAMNVANEEKRPGRRPNENHQYARGLSWLDRLRAPGGEAAMRRFALFYPHLQSPADVAGVERFAFAPLGRLADLPGAEASPDLVTAREAALRWRALPGPGHESWRVRLAEGTADLVADSG